MNEAGTGFERLYEIIARLRSPTGCPWDKKQTTRSMRPYLIEEIYECFDAMDSGDDPHVREELGDIFMLVTMIAYMKEQEGAFSVSVVLQEVCEKLIRRHPHVFGDVALETSDQVIRQWDEIKATVEGRAETERSVLSAVPRTMPPLERAGQLQRRAASAGFDWSDSDGVWRKLREELDELAGASEETARDSGGHAAPNVENELGDVLFSVVNLARFLHVDPAAALNRANSKFERRFSHVEAQMKREGRAMSAEESDRMDDLWNEAKRIEAN
jgi:nucleoside triphosphate diphosphatase